MSLLSERTCISMQCATAGRHRLVPSAICCHGSTLSPSREKAGEREWGCERWSRALEKWNGRKGREEGGPAALLLVVVLISHSRLTCSLALWSTQPRVWLHTTPPRDSEHVTVEALEYYLRKNLNSNFAFKGPPRDLLIQHSHIFSCSPR